MKETTAASLVQTLPFKRMRQLFLFIVLSFAAMPISVTAAAPGDLDPTFGTAGKMLDATFLGDPRGAVIQSDGKVVVVGNWGDFYLSFGLARYNSNGSLDTSFGSGGRAMKPNWFTFNSLAVQPDDKIVVIGTVPAGEQGSCFGLTRYNANGTIDSTFGDSGYDYPCVSGYDTGASVAIGPDGSIVAVGDSQLGFALAIFGGAIVTTPNYAQARSVAVQADGKIVVVGGINGSFLTVRYNVNGTLDSTFGNNGSVTTFMAGEAFSVTVQADGKIVAAGSTCLGCPKDGYSGFGLVRYNPDGSLDATFDSDGKVETAFSAVDIAYSVAIQPDGKIVAAGTCYGCQTRDFAIARYNSDGSLDTTFGNGWGFTTVDFNNSTDDLFRIALDRTGRLVVSGGSEGRTALARLLLAPRRIPFDFDGDRRSDIGAFRPSDSVWYLNRSTDGFFATQFGLPTDQIVPADYDGDGKTDIAVYRDGMWWVRKSADGVVVTIPFGQTGDVPVPADYTGDGRDELAVYRNGQWWTFDLSNEQSSLINFGLAADKPVPADFDGDGRVDQAVYREGAWHINRSSLGYTVVSWGLPSDRPVVGDYDGDGKADLAVYRDGTWYLQQSTEGFAVFQWGLSTDIPSPADYDGDGKTDATVYRDGVWYQLRSTGGISTDHFGLTGDQPLAASYIK